MLLLPKVVGRDTRLGYPGQNHFLLFDAGHVVIAIVAVEFDTHAELVLLENPHLPHDHSSLCHLANFGASALAEERRATVEARRTERPELYGAELRSGWCESPAGTGGDAPTGLWTTEPNIPVFNCC